MPVLESKTGVACGGEAEQGVIPVVDGQNFFDSVGRHGDGRWRMKEESGVLRA
jgi:hypothetical protein